MLLELRVRNFAIIDNVQVGFQSGLNILSGETGAGKSVLLKSLSLLLAAKSAPETVRAGCETAVIEGSFDLKKRPDVLRRLKELGYDTSEQLLLVRRVISTQGRNQVYLNDSVSTLNSLREIIAPLIEVTGHAVPLVEMTGQHDSRHLLSRHYHLDFLDRYAGLETEREEFRHTYQELKKIEQEITSLTGSSPQWEQKVDFLKFQKKEIEQLSLRPGEEVDLEAKVKRAQSSSRLQEFCAEGEQMLQSADSSVAAQLHKLLRRADEVARHDAALSEKIAPLREALTLVEEVANGLHEYHRSLHLNREEKERIESRLSQLRKLQKKYGPTTEDILSALSKITDELESYLHAEERLQQLETARSKQEQAAAVLSQELHKKRAVAAKQLETAVQTELLDLNMKGLEFHIAVEPSSQLSATGGSDVELMVRPSKKDPWQPLAKTASGGELSRILLSLKNVIGQSDLPRTYLFDEVDTGVSGSTAEKVGAKLKKISTGQQVICVTHLAQVAAFADAHFMIDKETHGDSVQMKIEPITASRRIHEIARLISGEKISATSLAHAQKLVDELADIKAPKTASPRRTNTKQPVA